jgi:hypothetical protein
MTFFRLAITAPRAAPVISVVAGLWLALWPLAASAQTSTIAGTVKDASGAVVPGVRVEASSSALIEKVRSATSDASGQYKIVGLRPGTYAVGFTLPGFSTTKQENVELTSDFTVQVNVVLTVGPLETTVTISPSTPVVDVQGITQRTAMTRDMLDAVPTGRNIQAVGILIPGTNLFVGGAGAISRDVGGSGGLQQSPLVYRGSIDAVQTIEGMRLNNLCANGAYSGVYWNDGSLQEISYVTGADSVEMGQGGIRINMVPRDGGNAFRAIVFGNYTQSGWAASNLGPNLHGDFTFSPANTLSNGALIDRIWDFNPSGGGPIRKDMLWFYATFRHWGVSKTVPDAYFDLDPSPFKYTADTSRPGLDDGHIVSRSGRITWQIGAKDKLSYYHDDQNKYRNHQGIAANVPPEATAIQVTPTSFVSVSRWTRTQSSRLLLDAGFAMYDQMFTERYRPEVQAFTPQQLYTVLDNATGKFSNAAPAGSAEHFSKLLTESASVSYVTGAHALKVGAAVSEGRWRLAQRFTGDIGQITYNAGQAANVILRLPVDRRNAIKADSAIFAQYRWTIGRLTVNAGLRFDWFIGETLPEDLAASQFGAGQHFGPCADGLNSNVNQCTGRVQNWKDLNPRVGVAYDLFGTGKTALKASFARYVAGEQIGRADSANPQTTLGLQDLRAWRDLDGNGLPLAANGSIQFNELTDSTATPAFGKNTNYDDDRRVGPERLVQARDQHGSHGQRESRADAARVDQCGIRAPIVRQPGLLTGHTVFARQLRRTVLHRRTRRYEPARRRGLSGVRAFRSQASTRSGSQQSDQVLVRRGRRDQRRRGVRFHDAGQVFPRHVRAGRTHDGKANDRSVRAQSAGRL